MVNKEHRTPQGAITTAGLAADTQKQAPINANLQKLLDVSEQLRLSKSKAIVFEKPLLYFGDKGSIFPNTINVVQGQNGSHKSRFAQLLSSLILVEADTEIGGFYLRSDKKYILAYIDTERNIVGQFPNAIQMIQRQANIPIEQDPPNFKYTSFIPIPRNERIEALKDYVLNLRKIYDAPLFVVLDIATDFINDFNNSQQSMEFIDFLNEMINNNDITFLCIIHENPNMLAKPRGHLGTELINKSSTAFQISLEKNNDDLLTDIISVKYKKNRSTKRLETFYYRCNEETQFLELLDEKERKALPKKVLKKAEESEIVVLLSGLMPQGEPIKGTELIAKLMNQFELQSETISKRLKVIETEKMPIYNDSDGCFYLVLYRKSREKFYELKPFPQDAE